jgi:hypothetical protein
MDTYSNYPVDSSDQDFSSAAEPWPAVGEPASETLSFSRALQGRPGGPGLKPSSAGPGPEPGRSPWRRSQQLWQESGAEWDVPATEETPPQVKYQGRHARSRRPAAPLSAPVFAIQDTGQQQAPDKGPRTRRRVVTVVLPTAVGATVAAVAITLLTHHGSKPPTASPAAPRAESKPQAPSTIGIYSGQQQRGVFQQIDSIADYGATIVTTGSQSSDGQVRQQFFASDDNGASWQLASVQAAGGGQPSLGHAATLIARGAAGWLAVGPQAIWASKDGLSWTLVAAHGITQGQVQVLTGTARGFLAAGTVAAPGGGTQAAVWISRDGTNWQQLTAAQLGLASGELVRDISAAASRGPDTVISGTFASGATGVWLSTDGGSSWTRVAVPAGHGAAGGIVGLSSDAAGLLAVRPGHTAGGVAYFSQNGLYWQYAGTIDPAGGWSPSAVRGGSGGFAVTGQTATGAIVAYTSTGNGAAWTPTGALGTGPMLSPAIAPGGTVVAAGATAASTVGQQGVLLEASRTGIVQSVPLANLPGAVVPELAMNAMAAAGDMQVAVGSADGYPAIWHRRDGGSWMLVSSSALTSEQDHLAALTAVTRGPDGWLAVGGPGPLAFTSADGVTWQPAPGLTGVSAVAVAAGPAGYAVVGGTASPGIWWSPDLTSWSRASGMTDGQVLAVAAEAHGFIAAGTHDGRPAVWTTRDGQSWTAMVLPPPAGASSAVLQQIAVSGNRVVALGQAKAAGGVVPFAVLSVDGGATWVQVPFAAPGPDTTFTALIASAHGFTAVGQYGQTPAAWTSASGTTWARTPLSGLTDAYHITALAPAGPAATAIGSVATEQSQGAFMVGVPDR